MMPKEFTELTGIDPTPAEYAEIESMYYDFRGNKREFCKWFMQNAGMMQTVQTLAAQKESMQQQITGLQNALRDAVEKTERLRVKLDAELDWQPYEYAENVRQADYEKLQNDSCTRPLSDAEAVQMLADEYGFEPSKIRIIHEVSRIEKNRHNYCRRCGSYERKALFNAWDWNYIRFDAARMTYEMYNGELQFFVH